MTKKQKEEFYGKKDNAGNWITPAGSHVTSDGVIVNKEGYAIGVTPENARRARMNADPDAVG